LNVVHYDIRGFGEFHSRPIDRGSSVSEPQ
jgi:hypothetical protein